ncbi:MAG: hypothetical protein QXQ81_07670, partial [Candidatus Thorarchaeota archaeon]
MISRYILLLAAAMVIFSSAYPANAAAVSIQFLQTDCLVYEIGQPLHMAAGVLAEFGDGGWCTVTFSIFSGALPVFED